MKFPLLPIGAQFEFDGKAYTKVSPLVAAAEDGSGQRVIPRYAMLKSVGKPVQATAAAHAGQLDEDRVLAAFERFRTECARLLDEACAEGDAERCAAFNAALADASRRFLDALHA